MLEEIKEIRKRHSRVVERHESTIRAHGRVCKIAARTRTPCGYHKCVLRGRKLVARSRRLRVEATRLYYLCKEKLRDH